MADDQKAVIFVNKGGMVVKPKGDHVKVFERDQQGNVKEVK